MPIGPAERRNAITDPVRASRCWVLTTGEAGMVSQALGLAEAVGLPVERKTIGLRAPWRWLPGHRCPGMLYGLERAGDVIAPPWPDLLVSCGRRSVAVALAVRRLSRGGTFAVHVQDPRVPPSLFDMVVPMAHDRVRAPNAVATLTALHRLTPGRLRAAAARFGARFANVPRPLVAVLIGGRSRAYRLSARRTAELADQLALLARHTGAGVLVTTSRRTGEENRHILRARLEGSAAWIWDGAGENPYLGMLALADFIIVTEDSVSMVSEACATGRPVYVAELPGGSRRLRAFHRALREHGVTRPFRGRLEPWSYAPLNETARVAGLVRARLGADTDVEVQTV